MKIRTLAGCLMLSFLLFPVQLFSAERGEEFLQKPELKSALEVLDRWIATRVAEREQPGLSVGIVYDQDLIWARGYGFADLEKRVPATPSTDYRIGSVSKLFTATAILQLRDAGKLRLDDPVAQYLSWFKVSPAKPDSPPITIRELITHTSGLPRESEGVYWNDGKFPAKQALIDALGRQQAVFPPATKLKYSNLAVSIAGHLVSEVSGEPYAQYVRNHILEPLGMSTTYVAPDEETPGLATGYVARIPGTKRTRTYFLKADGLTPAANLASNVNDLAKFVSLQFRDGPVHGSQILSGFTLDEMHRIQWLNSSWTGGYGLGFSISRVGDEVRVGHGGAVNGFRASVRFNPKTKFGVIVLANSGDGDPGSVSDQVFKIVEPQLVEATKPVRQPAIADPAWKKFIGTYTWEGNDFDIMIIDGRLTLVDPESDNPWSSKTTLEPAGTNTFRLQGGWADGELLRFELDAKGNVVRVYMPGEYSVPKSSGNHVGERLPH